MTPLQREVPVAPLERSNSGLYTTHGGAEADVLIQAHVDHIIAHLHSQWSGVLAVVLVGGFGRGEGGVRRLGDGSLEPQNDYDLVVVTARPIDPVQVQASRVTLAGELGIRWVDIVAYPKSKLSRLPLTLFNYDFRYAGRVVSGDSKLLTQVPSWRASRLPLEEAEILLFTRLWCFLGAYSLDFESRELTEEEARFLAQQMSKAMLAIQDAALIRAGEYDPSYRIRCDKYKSRLSCATQKVLVDFALRWKLSPPDECEQDVLAIYALLREQHLETMLSLGSHIEGQTLTSSLGYERVYWARPRNRWKRWVGQWRKNRFQLHTQAIRLAQLHLLACQRKAVECLQSNEEWVAPEMQRASSLMRRAFGVDVDPGQGWDVLREKAVELRMSV